MYISYDFCDTEEIENSGACFKNNVVYTARKNVGVDGTLYVIPQDDNEEDFILPATYADKLPKGDTIECTILCRGYIHEGIKVTRDTVFGLVGECVYDGGEKNNYAVLPKVKNGTPVEVSLDEYSK